MSSHLIKRKKKVELKEYKVKYRTMSRLIALTGILGPSGFH